MEHQAREHIQKYCHIWERGTSYFCVMQLEVICVFPFHSHSFKLGTLHCSLINDICQKDFKYVTIFMSAA